MKVGKMELELTSLQKEVVKYALYDHIQRLERAFGLLPESSSYYKKKWQHIRCARSLLKKFK